MIVWMKKVLTKNNILGKTSPQVCWEFFFTFHKWSASFQNHRKPNLLSDAPFTMKCCNCAGEPTSSKTILCNGFKNTHCWIRFRNTLLIPEGMFFVTAAHFAYPGSEEWNNNNRKHVRIYKSTHLNIKYFTVLIELINSSSEWNSNKKYWWIWCGMDQSNQSIKTDNTSRYLRKAIPLTDLWSDTFWSSRDQQRLTQKA